MAYFHGIYVLEISAIGGGTAVVPPIFSDQLPPSILSPISVTTPENGGWSMLLLADEVVTFAKLGTADSASFGLVGALLSLPAQDYEAGKRAFVCDLIATDLGQNTTRFSVTVTIGDVDETGPVITSPATGSVDENAAYSVNLTANKAATFAKRTGADTASFDLVGAALSLPARDFEAGKTLFTANLSATDAAGNVTNFTHAVTIRDVAEAPVLPANTLRNVDDTPITFDGTTPIVME